MSPNPYDYSAYQGICPISGEDFHGICKALAHQGVKAKPDLLIPLLNSG